MDEMKAEMRAAIHLGSVSTQSDSSLLESCPSSLNKKRIRLFYLSLSINQPVLRDASMTIVSAL